MAETKSAEQTRIAELEAQLAKANAQNATLTVTNTELIKAVKDVPVALPVQGTFKAKTRVGAEAKTVTFGFKKGHRFFRDEKATILDSELVMKLAAGESLTDEEKKSNPAVIALTKESAQEALQRLAYLSYAGLEEVK